MYDAPETFQQALNSFDPLLTVRRGRALHKAWVIERKAYIPPSEVDFLARRQERAFRSASKKKIEKPQDYAKAYDLACQIREEYEAAVGGKRVIIFVEKLDRRVFDALALGDVQRYGGFSRYISEIEARESFRDNDEKRMNSNQNEALSKEAYEKMNFLWDRRQTELIDGQTNMKELLK